MTTLVERHVANASDRYYDPTTAQFLTPDPLFALTGSRYGYAGNDPVNNSDPTGLWCLVHNDNGGCKGAGTVKRIAKDVYHPARWAATLPVSTTAMAVNEAYSLATGNDVSCRWNSRNWVNVCSGGLTIDGAPATTYGSTINTSLSYDRFMAQNNGRLMAHETKHSDQWAIFGPGFALLDGIASGCALAQGGQQHNVFERWAGLRDGGYTH